MTTMVAPRIRPEVRPAESVPDMVGTLVDTLGTTLVAYVANVRSRQMPNKWRNGSCVPRDDSLKRLILARDVLAQLVASDGPDVARQWFIGMNPWLNDDSPATRIRELDAASVRSAARAFVNDSSFG